MIRLRRFVVVAAVAVALAQGTAMAERLVTDPGTCDARNDGTLGVGFEFKVAADTVVNALGIWDDNDDGLVGSHHVVIWNAGNQSNVANVIIASGTDTPLVGHFRWANMALPVTLSVSATYRIMSYYNSDDPFRDHNPNPPYPLPSGQLPTFSSLLNSGVGVKAYFTNTSPSPAFPLGTGSWAIGHAYIGPNFSTVPIPEPGVLTLLVL
ncbi:MAG TPA: DUF4082 domain-containing protein, partial [Thermoguttaceae bacterium]|nr:DUF4082 domain-containing protein [Thermoguttaceae bacterium]